MLKCENPTKVIWERWNFIYYLIPRSYSYMLLLLRSCKLQIHSVTWFVIKYHNYRYFQQNIFCFYLRPVHVPIEKESYFYVKDTPEKNVFSPSAVCKYIFLNLSIGITVYNSFFFSCIDVITFWKMILLTKVAIFKSF